MWRRRASDRLASATTQHPTREAASARPRLNHNLHIFLSATTNKRNISLSPSLPLSHLVAAVTASTSGLRPGRPALVELAQVLHTRRLANEAVHLLLDRHVVAVLGLGEVAPGELGVDAVDNLERPACVRVWLMD